MENIKKTIRLVIEAFEMDDKLNKLYIVIDYLGNYKLMRFSDIYELFENNNLGYWDKMKMLSIMVPYKSSNWEMDARNIISVWKKIAKIDSDYSGENFMDTWKEYMEDDSRVSMAAGLRDKFYDRKEYKLGNMVKSLINEYLKYNTINYLSLRIYKDTGKLPSDMGINSNVELSNTSMN